jgi:hypothetical protein
VPNIPTPSLPAVFFGSAPATAVALVVSDVDATILSVRTPPRDAAGVSTVSVGDNATNISFAYTTPGGAAECQSVPCEVDALIGGSLTVRVSGLGQFTAATLSCTVDGNPATVTTVESTDAGSYNVVMALPGIGKQPDDPVTPGFLSIVVTVSGATAFAGFSYRSPPRAVSAEFSDDGSRIDIFWDQVSLCVCFLVFFSLFVWVDGVWCV